MLKIFVALVVLSLVLTSSGVVALAKGKDGSRDGGGHTKVRRDPRDSAAGGNCDESSRNGVLQSQTDVENCKNKSGN